MWQRKEGWIARGATMWKLNVALLATGLLSTHAQASEWWVVAYSGQAPARATYSSDLSSLRLVGDYRQMWLKTIRETPQDLVKSKAELMQYDCIGRRERVIQTSAFTVNVGDIGKFSLAPSDWTFEVPDSVGEALLVFACGNHTAGVKLNILPDAHAADFFKTH
jgi:hypothetical protein